MTPAAWLASRRADRIVHTFLDELADDEALAAAIEARLAAPADRSTTLIDPHDPATAAAAGPDSPHQGGRVRRRARC